MAKRTGGAVVTRHKGGGGDSIVVIDPPRPAAPIVKKERRRGRRRGGGGGAFGRSAKGTRMMGCAVGGFAYGVIEKNFPGLPSLPLVGKAGSVAIGVYFLGGSNDLINDIGIAAASIAGYQLGKEGVISGYDDRHGLAAET